MTHTTPTLGHEPQQPGEREALARAIDRLLGWGYLRQYAGMSREWMNNLRDAIADAALAHFAERRAGDVEAVASVEDLDALPDDSVVLSSGGNALTTDRGRDGSRVWIATGDTMEYSAFGVVDGFCPVRVIYRPDQAAQIAALTPTRGVSAEPYLVEYAVLLDDRGSMDHYASREQAVATALGFEEPGEVFRVEYHREEVRDA